MTFDFSAFLVLLVAASGGIWAVDAIFFAAKRQTRFAGLPPNGETETSGQAQRRLDHTPVLVDYARSFFPIFMIVLVLRSFIVEPFRIPSGSMIPTLLVGDFILVNKFAYGIRLPVVNEKIFEIGSPKRGDVTVFRYPKDPSTPFIKRIIGLPGDTVEYRDKKVYINGKLMTQNLLGTYIGLRSAAQHTGAVLIEEDLGELQHQLIISQRRSLGENIFTVPAGQYFVLGDNRDNSRDSRFWGFVPDENLVGKAFAIWMSWDQGPNFSRIGTTIE